LGCEEAERALGERAKERRINSVELEHREEELGGDARPETLRERLGECVMERGAEGERQSIGGRGAFMDVGKAARLTCAHLARSGEALNRGFKHQD
jgi:hypothetical protein